MRLNPVFAQALGGRIHALPTTGGQDVKRKARHEIRHERTVLWRCMLWRCMQWSPGMRVRAGRGGPAGGRPHRQSVPCIGQLPALQNLTNCRDSRSSRFSRQKYRKIR